MKSIIKGLLVVTIFIFSQQPIHAQDSDKIITLTVSGSGKTIEEAKNNALRSAIEQAFGAFISSKTEILNDNLIKDEIVSVASGNVQKYEIVSQVELPNIGFAITLTATVSIDKLASFAESKGISVEFKGGLFAANMIMQKLNEDAELIAIKNLTKVSFELLNKSFDYELDVSEPKLVQNTNEIYEVTFNIKTKENSNYNNFKSYFINTIQNLNINTNEYENITKSGKKVGYLFMDYKLYRLRNKKSSDALIAFFTTSQLLLKNFKIATGLDNLNIEKRKLFFKTPEKINTANQGLPFFKINDENTLLKASIMNQDRNKHYQSYNERLLKELENINISEDDIKNKINNYQSSKELIAPYCYYKLDDEKINFENYMAHFNKRPYSSWEQKEWLSDMIIFDTSFNSPKITYRQGFNISELQKIDSFKIEKLPIN